MNFEQGKDGVLLDLSVEEAERIKTVIVAVGGISTTSLEMGVIEQALKLAAKVIESKGEVPVMVLREAVIVDLILRMGLEVVDAEAPTRETTEPEGGAGEPSSAPLPGTST